jgi:Kef-type K+ transport system membrane component KefB
MEAGAIVGHIVVVTILMIIGKMFPLLCYQDEAPLSARLALCLGMCPRGEVGASIIVISLDLGISGPAIPISMCALVINLTMSGAFIGAAKFLLRGMDLDHDGVIDEEEWKVAQQQFKAERDLAKQGDPAISTESKQPIVDQVIVMDLTRTGSKQAATFVEAPSRTGSKQAISVTSVDIPSRTGSKQAIVVEPNTPAGSKLAIVIVTDV